MNLSFMMATSKALVLQANQLVSYNPDQQVVNHVITLSIIEAGEIGIILVQLLIQSLIPI